MKSFKLSPDRFSLITLWVINGRVFGYPDCCIGEFCADAVLGTPRDDIRKLHGTGYRPCLKCNDLTIQQLKANIKKNRKFPAQFPLDDIEEESA